MSKNCSSTSQYVRTAAAAWILVLLLALQMLQNNSANSVVAEIFQLYLHKACVTKKRTKPYSRTIMIFCMTTAGYSTRAYRFLRKSANNCLYLQLSTTGSKSKLFILCIMSGCFKIRNYLITCML